MADDTKQRPPIGEYASVARNPYYRPAGGILYPRDPTLRARGGGRMWEIYEDALLDPRVRSAMQKRRTVLSAYPYEIKPASDATADEAAAEFVRTAFQSIAIHDLLEYLQDAVLFGFAVVELIWELVDGQWWIPTGIMIRDQRRFRFDEQNNLRMIDFTNLLQGQPVPERKFVVHTYDAKDGDPYGRGLGSIVWWSAYFKRQNMAAWSIYNEKYGAPTAWAKHKPDASNEEKDALFDVAQGFATDAAIMTPDDASIELIQANGSAGAETFKLFKDSLNEDIVEVILGGMFGSNAGPLNGGTAAGADQEDRLELARSDGQRIAQTLNTTLLRWLIEINMPGAKPPTIEFQIDAEEDLGARVDRDTKVAGLGFEVSEAYIQDTYGGEWTKKAAPRLNDAPPIGGGQSDQPSAPSFAEQIDHNHDIDQAALVLAQKAGDEAAPVVEGWVDQIHALLASSGSMEEARDRIIGLYTTMNADPLAATMQDAGTLADLMGRANVPR